MTIVVSVIQTYDYRYRICVQERSNVVLLYSINIRVNCPTNVIIKCYNSILKNSAQLVYETVHSVEF